MRLLLVEDEDRIASFVQKGLSAHGYTVERVATGAEAVVRAGSREFDLAILDLGLTDMDGREVLMGWRDRGIAVPVLILSASLSHRDVETWRGLPNVVDALAKPYDLYALLTRIDAVCGERVS